jgi:predicted chitinase
MKIERKEFFDNFRVRFQAKLNQKQVDGYSAMFDYWESSTLNDKRWLAYALATAYHETGATMQAVREGFCDSDACSVKAVTKLFTQGRIKRNYALPHPNGNSYFGRGLVQITHGYNYERMGTALGMGRKLYDDPSLALDTFVAVQILFVGMRDGLFTGKRFADYFGNTKTDWLNARRIINGVDKAEKIAAYARDFYACLG